MQTTYMAKKNTLRKEWFIVDAQHEILGRMASQIAMILMGKNHPWYTPHVDTGDFVVIINADKVKITGKKGTTKLYYHWSGYPGGLKIKQMKTFLSQSPVQLIYLAVRRMLPKSKLGRKMLRKLKIYQGSEHPHQAQCPKIWKNEPAKLKEVLIHE